MCVYCEYLPLPVFMPSNSHICYIGKRGISHAHRHTFTVTTQRIQFTESICMHHGNVCVHVHVWVSVSGMSLGNQYIHRFYVHFALNVCIEFVCMSSRLDLNGCRNITCKTFTEQANKRNIFGAWICILSSLPKKNLCCRKYTSTCILVYEMLIYEIYCIETMHSVYCKHTQARDENHHRTNECVGRCMQ